MLEPNFTADTHQHYVNLTGPVPVIMERPILTLVASWNKTTIVADGEDEASFGPGIPVGTTVRVHPNSDAFGEGIQSDMNIVVNDGVFEFVATVPGSYFIIFENPFPYKTLTQEIIAT